MSNLLVAVAGVPQDQRSACLSHGLAPCALCKVLAADLERLVPLDFDNGNQRLGVDKADCLNEHCAIDQCQAIVGLKDFEWQPFVGLLSKEHLLLDIAGIDVLALMHIGTP